MITLVEVALENFMASILHKMDFITRRMHACNRFSSEKIDFQRRQVQACLAFNMQPWGNPNKLGTIRITTPHTRLYFFFPIKRIIYQSRLNKYITYQNNCSIFRPQLSHVKSPSNIKSTNCMLDLVLLFAIFSKKS